MSQKYLILALRAVIICILTPVGLILAATPGTLDVPTRTQVSKTYGKLPLSFEENLGQFDSRVKFLSRGSSYTLFLTSTGEAVLTLREPVKSDEGNERSALSTALREDKSLPDMRTATVRMRLIEANPQPQVTGLEELSGKVNYFTGNDPKKWRADISTYARVQYRDVYPGVDLVFYGNQRQLEYDFIVAPGADPAVIMLGIEGTEQIILASEGHLILETSAGTLQLQKPRIYQERNGVREFIQGDYVLEGAGQVSFQVAAYDPTRPLVIDPVVLSYSTYLGGSGEDLGYDIAVDAAGNAYITGHTLSSDFPTASPIQAAFGGNRDAFVTKLNAAGSAIVYSTYLGGNNYDMGLGLALDAAGNAYLTGLTASANFPTTSGAFQPTFQGLEDAFVTKLNAAGSALVYSTYLGGTSYDEGYHITVDADGNAYTGGWTESPDFPTVSAFQAECSPGCHDGFVTKLNATGSALVYSTYLGGSGGHEIERDFVNGIAVNSAGEVYVAGPTSAPDFPTVNPIQATLRGPRDSFVAKFNATGDALVYSTYLGGNGTDRVRDLAVDPAGNAYVVGWTDSADFPTVNAFQAGYGGGGTDGFVTKLNATGSALVYSTYLGGSGEDQTLGITVDATGNAYVGGATESLDFPTVNAFQAGYGGGRDYFVTKLDATGSALVYSTYLGGSGEEARSTFGGVGPGSLYLVMEIAVDPAGNAYVTGTTSSADFPTANPMQPALGGGEDAFVAKIVDQAKSVDSQTVLVANFINGNNADLNARVYLFNPSESGGEVTVRVFTLPLIGGMAEELTAEPFNLGTLEARSALNLKLAEDILTLLGIPLPYTDNGGNLTLEFTVQAANVRGTAQVFSSDFAFGTYPLQEIPSTSAGSPTVLVANFANGNNAFMNSRVYLWNPSESAGSVTVRVFTLPTGGGLAQELTAAPLNLEILAGKSALNIKVAEDILTLLGIIPPYVTDGGNLTLEFTIHAPDVRGIAQVFSSDFAFGTYPMAVIP